jgi:hypothetical protein
VLVAQRRLAAPLGFYKIDQLACGGGVVVFSPQGSLLHRGKPYGLVVIIDMRNGLGKSGLSWAGMQRICRLVGRLSRPGHSKHFTSHAQIYTDGVLDWR